MSIVPNSTQVPNKLLDEWMPHLKDVELRVLLVIVRQTLGWIEDAETGRRKEKDWISHSQLIKKTGRSSKHVSSAVETLSQYHLIQTVTEDGRILETPQDRAMSGSRIYFRLHSALNAPSLFDATPDKRTRATEAGKRSTPVKKDPPQKGRTTKETQPTKETTLQSAKPTAGEKDGDSERKANHKAFMDFYWTHCQRLRGVKPIITGMDGKNLKRVLSIGVPEHTLEQAAIYFLAYYRDFSPSISTFLSAGVLNGMLNRMRNEEGFWKRLDSALGQTEVVKVYEKKSMADSITKMREAMSSRMTIKNTDAIPV